MLCASYPLCSWWLLPQQAMHFFELIDIYTTGGSILIVLLALIAIVLVATGIAMLVPIHQLQLHLVRVFQRRIQLLFGHHLEETQLTFPISASNRSIRKQRCSSALREFAP